MVESLFMALVMTAVLFAALQLCILSVDDMICNEAAFAAMRVGIVTPAARVREVVERTADRLLLPHTYARTGIVPREVTVWHDTVQGVDLRDHGDRLIEKYNANIKYDVRIMFSSLLAPWSHARLFAGGDRALARVARARFVKSPDEEFYYAAYPGARPFTEHVDDGA